MRRGLTKLSRNQFYRYGGFSNPNQFRKGTRTGWSYWKIER